MRYEDNSVHAQSETFDLQLIESQPTTHQTEAIVRSSCKE